MTLTPSTARFAMIAPLVFLFPKGCIPNLFAYHTVITEKLAAAPFGLHAVAKPNPDHYVAITADKKVDYGVGSVRMPRELWAPFRWEATAGMFDPAHLLEAPGLFYSRVDLRDSDPEKFYQLSGVPQGGGGIRAQVFTHQSTLGDLLFPDATILDFAIEADATTLHFLARKLGEVAFQEVAQVALPADGPFVPGFGASNMNRSSVAGFDNFRVVFTAAPPEDEEATPERLAAQSLHPVLDNLVETLRLLDTSTTDVDGAKVALQAALDELATSVTEMKELAKTSPLAKKVKGRINAACNSAKAVRKSLDKGKTPVSLWRAVRKIQENVLVSINTLDP